MRVFTRLTLLDTIQGTVGAVSLIPDAITRTSRRYTNIAFMESVHAKAQQHLLDAVPTVEIGKGLPLVGEHQSSAQRPKSSWSTTRATSR